MSITLQAAAGENTPKLNNTPASSQQEQQNVKTVSRSDSQLETGQAAASTYSGTKTKAYDGNRGSSAAFEEQARRAAAQDEADEEVNEARREQAEQLVEDLKQKKLGLSFEVEKDLDRTLISVTDKSTEDVIRQIPSEEFVRIAKSMQKFRDGTLVGPEANAVMIKSENPPELKGVLFDHNA